MRGGGDGVVTSNAGREIQVRDERAEIKRGKPKKRLRVECRQSKREKLKGCGRVVY